MFKIISPLMSNSFQKTIHAVCIGAPISWGMMGSTSRTIFKHLLKERDQDLRVPKFLRLEPCEHMISEPTSMVTFFTHPLAAVRCTAVNMALETFDNIPGVMH